MPAGRHHPKRQYTPISTNTYPDRIRETLDILDESIWGPLTASQVLAPLSSRAKRLVRRLTGHHWCKPVLDRGPPGSLHQASGPGGSSSVRGLVRHRVRLVLEQTAGAEAGPGRAADPEIEHGRRAVQPCRVRGLGARLWSATGQPERPAEAEETAPKVARRRVGPRDRLRSELAFAILDQGLIALLAQPLQLGPGRAKQPSAAIS